MGKTIFAPSSNAPISTFHSAFYLDSRVEEGASEAIIAHGGLITPVLTETCVHLMPFPPKHTVPETINHAVYSYLFVLDSIHLQALQSLKEYQLATQITRQIEKKGRNLYTYEEELRMFEYVKTHSEQGIRSLPYWIKARDVLGNAHSADSMRTHYKQHMLKMECKKRGDVGQVQLQLSKVCEKRPEIDPNSVKISILPTKKVQIPSSLKRENPTKVDSPPRKSLKAESPPPSSPIPPLKSPHLITSLSQLQIDDFSYGESETLACFCRLVEVCSACSQSQLPEREVLRTLLHFKGEVQATVLFFTLPH